jgi:cyclopropane fatty-acyl-phospholipid synthase-like methyltransferase
LFQPLARLGATVVGVDMVEENIRVAQTHLMEDPIIVERVKYIHGAVEDLVMTKEGRFDAVVASEVVEIIGLIFYRLMNRRERADFFSLPPKTFLNKYKIKGYD